MACDAQSIATATKCYLTLSRHQLLASWALTVCETGGPTPSGDRFVTEGGDPIITEGGDQLVPE